MNMKDQTRLANAMNVVRAEAARLGQLINDAKDPVAKQLLIEQLGRLHHSSGFQLDKTQAEVDAIPRAESGIPDEVASKASPEAQAAAQAAAQSAAEETTKEVKLSVWKRFTGWISAKYHGAVRSMKNNPWTWVASVMVIIAAAIGFFAWRSGKLTTASTGPVETVQGMMPEAETGGSAAASFGAKVGNLARAGFGYVVRAGVAVKDFTVGLFQKAPAATVPAEVVIA